MKKIDRVPRILIAYDGSECSKNALVDLKRAGLPEKAEALIVTVADTWASQNYMAYDPGLNPQWAALMETQLSAMKASVKEAGRDAEGAAKKIKASFPGWKVSVEALADLPVWGIMNKIESWKPDLAVMGSHGRSAVGRIFFGSVSHRALTHAHCNLRISRENERKASKNEPMRILVAFDGSQESETAFESALRRDWPKGTRIKIITVIDTRVSLAFLRPTSPIRYWVKNGDRDPVAWIDRMLADQKKRIQKKGFIGDAEALKGDPKRMLLQEAENWRADCVFVGTRGLTGNDRIVVGSVSTAVAMHAHCPVEVVHRPWTANSCCETNNHQHRVCMTNA